MQRRGKIACNAALAPGPGPFLSPSPSPAPRSAAVPVIRRFTGGGTVVVDEGTLFVSFVANRGDVGGAPLYPREIMAWSQGLYAPLLARLAPGSPFHLHEHDYCLGDFKVGGNAQSVSRDRWVHHTSWLWDFTPARMALLALPSKRPAYRRDRPHTSFLTRLREHVTPSSSTAFMDGVAQHAAGVWEAAGHGPGVNVGLEAVQAALVGNERRSNSFVDMHALEEVVPAAMRQMQ
jgi:hypothetical protein